MGAKKENVVVKTAVSCSTMWPLRCRLRLLLRVLLNLSPYAFAINPARLKLSLRLSLKTDHATLAIQSGLPDQTTLFCHQNIYLRVRGEMVGVNQLT